MAQMSTPARPIPEPVPRRGAVLVIEDRDDVRQGMAQLLELHGFLVADARDGDEAFQQLTSEPRGFALILLDLMLPGGLSGREFRMRQLADPALAAIPTVVVTVVDSDPQERAALRTEGRRSAPADGFSCWMASPRVSGVSPVISAFRSANLISARDAFMRSSRRGFPKSHAGPFGPLRSRPMFWNRAAMEVFSSLHCRI